MTQNYSDKYFVTTQLSFYPLVIFRTSLSDSFRRYFRTFSAKKRFSSLEGIGKDRVPIDFGKRIITRK